MFNEVDYHGMNPQWWRCKFFGEDGSDAGGLFRDCMSNIAEELMNRSTPLFIECGNELSGKVWVPNPACHDQLKWRFLGQLMGACIRSSEKLAVVPCSRWAIALSCQDRTWRLSCG